MRVTRGGAKKVESEGGLLEEGGPVSEGEGGVHRRESRDEVVLERADCALSLVGAVHMWGSELNVDGCLAEGCDEVRWDLVVKNMEGGVEAAESEEAMQVGHHPCPFGGGAGAHGLG